MSLISKAALANVSVNPRDHFHNDEKSCSPFAAGAGVALILSAVAFSKRSLLCASRHSFSGSPVMRSTHLCEDTLKAAVANLPDLGAVGDQNIVAIK